MQMNFTKTPLGTENNGKELYFLAYTGNDEFFVKKVMLIDLNCIGWNKTYGYTEAINDHYCAIFEYIDNKGKNKQFKLKWTYSKYEKPVYKKSKNFVYFKNCQITCLKTDYFNSGNYSIYITEKKELMDKYINEHKIIDNAISLLTKKRNALDKQITEITNIKY